MSWRDELDRLPRLGPSQVELEPGTTALVVVDMQYVDAHADYGFGRWLAETGHGDLVAYYSERLRALAIPNTRRLLEEFRGRGLRVIHLTIGSELPDRADYTGIDAELVFDRGSFEHGILPEVAPVEGELVVNKTSRSAFSSTGLERTLLNLGVRTLVVTGVSTSVCVDLTARDAADRGFGVVVVEDATADLAPQWHDAALLQFAMRWGRVLSTDETLEALAAERSAAG